MEEWKLVHAKINIVAAKLENQRKRKRNLLDVLSQKYLQDVKINPANLLGQGLHPKYLQLFKINPITQRHHLEVRYVCSLLSAFILNESFKKEPSLKHIIYSFYMC